jgi:hypothetical protein
MPMNIVSSVPRQVSKIAADIPKKTSAPAVQAAVTKQTPKPAVVSNTLVRRALADIPVATTVTKQAMKRLKELKEPAVKSSSSSGSSSGSGDDH